MGRVFASAAVAVLCLAVATPALAGDPRGNWLTENSRAKVTIVSCGGGALCGNIVALKEPNDPATGRPRTDKNNPDAAKPARPVIGVQIVIDMKPDTADKWKGRVYNVEDGKTYSGSITLVNATTLNLQGCALGGLICKTQTWARTN